MPTGPVGLVGPAKLAAVSFSRLAHPGIHIHV